MKLSTNFEGIERRFGLVIGSFDGCHKAHIKLLEGFVSRCEIKRIIPVVLTFNPHPIIFINKKENYLLGTPKSKQDFFTSVGIGVQVTMEFNTELQQMSAAEFLEQCIFSNNFLEYLHLGHDFALGSGKQDSVKLIESLSDQYKVELFQETSFEFKQKVVSSSLIRDYLWSDKLEQANEFLGHFHTVSGKVIHGEKIGQKHLVRTANLKVNSKYLVPNSGVYQVLVVVAGKSYQGICNIGINPTVDLSRHQKIEVHIFDFEQEIYDLELTVKFIKKLRDEKKFNSVKELKHQIENDIALVKSRAVEAFALVGRNIAQSLSPAIYERLLSGVNYSLLDWEDQKHSANELLNIFKGINITSPYKKMFLDEVKMQGEIKFALNCMIKNNAELLGINTDYLACKDIINRKFKKIKNVIILGDGDMARVLNVLYEKRGITPQMLSRRQKNLERWTQIVVESKEDTLVINSCSKDYTLPKLPDRAFWLWDLNYNVDYYDQVLAKGQIDFCDGIELLNLQAKYAINFWNLKN